MILRSIQLFVSVIFFTHFSSLNYFGDKRENVRLCAKKKTGFKCVCVCVREREREREREIQNKILYCHVM